MDVSGSLVGRAKFHMNFLVWKCRISCEFLWLEVPNFISICQLSYEFLFLEVPNFIWISLLGSLQFHMKIWNYMIGSVKFHEFLCLEASNFRWTNEIAKFDLKFPDWNCQISSEICLHFLIESAKFCMDFPLWKCPVSYEHMTFIDCQIYWKRCRGLITISCAPDMFLHSLWSKGL